ncbi:MAG: glycosyltransferase family 4 protein [Nitrososphaerota archaeon]|jgi:glycosyltransferase involved in cell wall biosynthesis|nr:glycosyltransferase family 4 protein [Nitrososphaerota archaeon]
MKLAIDCRFSPNKGVARTTQTLVNGLIKFNPNLKMILLVRNQYKEYCDNFNSQSIEYLDVNMGYFSLADLYKLPEILELVHPDLFLATQFYVSPLMKIPTVRWVHDLWPITHPEFLPKNKEMIKQFGSESIKVGELFIKEFEKILNSAESKKFDQSIHKIISSESSTFVHKSAVAAVGLCFHNSSKVIVPSKFVASKAIFYFPGYAHKIKVLYEAVSDNFSDLNKKREKYLYVQVGKWESRKNILASIYAVDKLRQSKNIEARLILVGNENYRDYGKKILKILKNPYYSEFVQHLGEISDRELNEIYNRSTALLFPSINEGFGLPVIEAMATGLPVIASNTAALPEVANNSALLIDPHDLNEFYYAINILTFNDSLKRYLSWKGKKRAKLFSELKMAKNFLKIILGNLH